MLFMNRSFRRSGEIIRDPHYHLPVIREAKKVKYHKNKLKEILIYAV